MTASLDGITERNVDPEPGPERVAADREAAQAWRTRLDALPRRYREAVELRHVDGLAYPEVAEAVGRPLGTVKSDVHRGVRLLREAWHREQVEVASSAEPRAGQGPVRLEAAGPR
jgi:RNA polymerase sigma factor (sigma-70 family)